MDSSCVILYSPVAMDYKDSESPPALEYSVGMDIDIEAVRQMLLADNPISSPEILEMIKRNILSMDPSKADTTAYLIGAYISLAGPLDFVPKDKAEEIMTFWFWTICAAGAKWEWPVALPKDMDHYPLNVLKEIASELGLRTHGAHL
jgi:hypothetical protein